MLQKGILAGICVLVLLLELTTLAPGQQCSSTCQPILGPPGRDGRDGKDGSPGVFTHEDFVKLKEMLANEGVSTFQNSCPSSCTTANQTDITTQTVTVTQTDTTTQIVQSTTTCPTPSLSPVPTVTEYLTMNQTVTTTQTDTTTQVVHSTSICPTPTPGVQRDCKQFRSNGFNQSGVYTIQPDSLQPFDIYCDMDTDGGGWSVFQRREDGSIDFDRNWVDYAAGFGNPSGEFWLGLEYINRLCSESNCELRIDLGDFDNETAYAKYSSFNIDDASTNYNLTVSGFNGTVRDCLEPSNGWPFTTYDRDNDNIEIDNCAQFHSGAWWYNKCSCAILNGRYLGASDYPWGGVVWYRWRQDSSLKFSEMKVRRVN